MHMHHLMIHHALWVYSYCYISNKYVAYLLL